MGDAMIYLVACPERCVLPGGIIDAKAGHAALPEETPDSRERLEHHLLLSDEPLTIHRCRRDLTWWVVVP